MADTIAEMIHKGDKARARLRAAAMERSKGMVMLGHLARLGWLIQTV
jgi:hypothetical protein